jgi:AmmeMemoRadiSam system protein B
VYGGHAYRTPLGDVRVDTDAVQQLAATDRSIRISGAGHDIPRHERGEHGIEVQLPFLQRALSGLTIVPIVMGSQSWEACEGLGSAIAGVADWSSDIMIASSDLSHFHDDRRARELDGAFQETFLTLDARALHDRIARGECEACGAGPVVASLLATTRLRNRGAEIIASGNSGDVSNDRARVVGYLSAVVTGDIP